MTLSRLFLFIMVFCGSTLLGHAMDTSGGRGLAELCERRGLECSVDDISHLVTLSRGSAVARAVIGSNTVTIGRETIAVSSPVSVEGDRVVVPPDFDEKIVPALLAPVYDTALPPQRLTIVIDPGHGGKDPGAAAPNGMIEKNLVLDISRRLRDELQSRGYHVILTRDSDIFLSLEERTEIASRANADLFVSIHANSNPSKQVQGTEIYTMRDLNYQELREDQRQRNYAVLFNQLQMDRDHPHIKTIVADLLYAYKRGESNVLADRVSGEIRRHANSRCKTLPSGFFVVRNTLIPSVLIETGYLTNPREERLLGTAEYRDKLVAGVAEGIEGYFQR